MPYFEYIIPTYLIMVKKQVKYIIEHTSVLKICLELEKCALIA